MLAFVVVIVLAVAAFIVYTRVMKKGGQPVGKESKMDDTPMQTPPTPTNPPTPGGMGDDGGAMPMPPTPTEEPGGPMPTPPPASPEPPAEPPMSPPAPGGPTTPGMA